MKQRNIFLVGLYGFITFQFYILFWLHNTRKEMLDRGIKGIPSIWWLAGPTIAALVVIPLIFLIPLLSASSPSQGDEVSTVVLVVFMALFIPLMLALFGIWIWWIYKYSQAVETVTEGQTPFTLTFALGVVFMFIGIQFIWPVIIQDGFNKVGRGQQPQPSPAGMPASPVSPAASAAPETPAAPVSPNRDA
jgi:hypothetical protein